MNTEIWTALVIGAGIAGLSCAGALRDANVAVTLMDKGRRPGGRVATRRADGMVFNHGAQFASARGPGFAALLRISAAAPWPEAGAGRFAFQPGMSALPAAIAEGLTVLTERHVAFLHWRGDAWDARHFPAAAMRPGEIANTGGDIAGPFDAVLVAAPAPQAAALLDTAGHAALSAAARTAVIAPCWAVMARFPSPVDGPGVLRSKTAPIAWAARESSRPGGLAGAETWTLHAGAAWSRTHLEDPPETVCAALLAEFRSMTGAPEADWSRAHRWRHALVETPVGQPSLWDSAARLGACGDWCLGGRIEAAFDSGASLATQVIAAV
jgi:predicted NAD/FAD-dependent oxidoreductase